MALHGQTHWFQEGFAEFFGAADRISSQTGEWRLLRPHVSRLKEWQHHVEAKNPEWTLREVLEMRNSMQLQGMAMVKMPKAQGAMVSLYYCQAWALNHYLYFGKEAAYREKYLKIVNDEMRCVSGADVFYRHMEAGTGEAREKFLEDLEDEIRGYVRGLQRKLR
jgi:hypothetical protein